MHKYTATFADGTTITRKSERAYVQAWRATWNDGEPCAVTGFSSVPGFKPEAPRYIGLRPSMSRAERRAATKANAERIASFGYRVEYAEAQVSA